MDIVFPNLFASRLEGNRFTELGQAHQQLIHSTCCLGSEREAQDRHIAMRVPLIAFFLMD